MNEYIKQKIEPKYMGIPNMIGFYDDCMLEIELHYIFSGGYKNKLIIHVYDPETKEFDITGWCSKLFTGLKIICPFFNGIPEEHYNEFAKTGNVYYILTDIGNGKFHLLYHWDKELFLREYYEK